MYSANSFRGSTTTMWMTQWPMRRILGAIWSETSQCCRSPPGTSRQSTPGVPSIVGECGGTVSRWRPFPQFQIVTGLPAVGGSYRLACGLHIVQCFFHLVGTDCGVRCHSGFLQQTIADVETYREEISNYKKWAPGMGGALQSLWGVIHSEASGPQAHALVAPLVQV